MFANIDKFLAMFETIKLKFHVLIFTETWYNNDNVVSIADYSGHHTVRAETIGGGVSLFCASEFRSEKVHHLCKINNSIETCVVKIDSHGNSIIVVAIYRPPAGSIENCIETLMSILNDTLLLNSEIIIVGDLNINIMNYADKYAHTKKYVYNLYSMNFLPLLTSPTRIASGNQHGSPSLLHHVWYSFQHNKLP